ncbi:MAG: 50S ribosomal protein L4 [Microgenomates group bacterium GW2011_GWB1_40_9]|nr:MAG: ribosomal protein L4/L1e, large subunit ribosomal protein L4 [Microgenomates group bacterium GW2011_GWC1_39_12]KKR78814.1 MAG: 50S ribosomal protein L4 [Microgenomates group bacterium GW2011_GWB1_40_9]
MATIKKTTKVKKITATKKAVAPASKKEVALSASLYTSVGISAGKEKLPKEVFGVKINLQIIAQAVRVYRANQREGSATAKTRGEVTGSTRKIYKQKGTGRARHGNIRAPIFVGGGIVFGPRIRDYSKNLPQSMRSLALASSLSYQQKEGRIVVIEKTNDCKPKTSIIAKGLVKMGVLNPVLVVVHDTHSPFVQAIRNIEKVTFVPASQVTTYDVVTHKTICITKESIEILLKRV